MYLRLELDLPSACAQTESYFIGWSIPARTNDRQVHGFKNKIISKKNLIVVFKLLKQAYFCYVSIKLMKSLELKNKLLYFYKRSSEIYNPNASKPELFNKFSSHFPKYFC